MKRIEHGYSQTWIYVLLHIRTSDLHTNFSECITVYKYLKFDIRTSLNALEFNIRNIQSMHKKYRSTYIKVQRPHRITWGLPGKWFIKIEIFHNFQLFGNAGVITLPWL
jgi:hypothetical protein